MTGPACAGSDTDIWFEQTPSYDPEFAKIICGDCPVRDACLSYALRLHIPDGIFGGLTPSQRNRYRRGGR